MLQALSREELLALPAAVPLWPTAARAIGIGKSKAYEMAINDEFPVPVLRLGKVYRVRSADLLDLLGIAPHDDSRPPGSA